MTTAPDALKLPWSVRSCAASGQTHLLADTGDREARSLLHTAASASAQRLFWHLARLHNDRLAAWTACSGDSPFSGLPLPVEPASVSPASAAEAVEHILGVLEDTTGENPLNLISGARQAQVSLSRDAACLVLWQRYGLSHLDIALAFEEFARDLAAPPPYLSVSGVQQSADRARDRYPASKWFRALVHTLTDGKPLSAPASAPRPEQEPAAQAPGTSSTEGGAS